MPAQLYWIKIDPTLNVVEVCCHINELRQVRLVNGKIEADTPDELFNKFKELSVSLPDKTNTWTLKLCSSFLSALSGDLQEAITSVKGFTMPDLSILTTKAL